MKNLSKKWTNLGLGFVFWAGTCVGLAFGQFTMITIFVAIFFAMLSSLYFSAAFTLHHEEQFHSGVRK